MLDSTDSRLEPVAASSENGNGPSLYIKDGESLEKGCSMELALALCFSREK